MVKKIMLFIRNILKSAVLRGAVSMALGVAVMAGLVSLLAYYAEAPEHVTKTAFHQLRFPENEKMLNEMAAELARENGAALSDIAPAAGNAVPSKPQESKTLSPK